MKKIPLYLILLLIAGCTSTEPNVASQDGTVEKNEDSIAKPGLNPSQEPYLTIHGKDIWVRDSSSTGPVIMKLNEGDRCKYLETGHLEIIKGKPGYWYKVDFQGQQGWVFGAQTDWRDRNVFLEDATSSNNGYAHVPTRGDAVLKGKTIEAAWETFRAYKVELCKTNAARTEENSTEYWAGNGCKMTERGGKSFMLYEYNEDGYFQEEFLFGTDTISDLWLSSVRCERGAVSESWQYKTLVGYKNKEDWELLGLIPGELNDEVSLGKDTVLYAFETGWDGISNPPMGEWGVAIWRSIGSQHSFQQLQIPKFPSYTNLKVEDEQLDQTELIDYHETLGVQFTEANGRIGLEMRGNTNPKSILWWNPRKNLFLPN